MIEAIETALNTGTKDPKVEEWILRGKNCRSSDSCPPGHAFRNALEVLGDRWPEAEEIILSDSVVAVRYAKEAMKTRWPLLEKQLLKGRRIPLIVEYARDVIGGPWPEAEIKIRRKKDAEWMVLYAREVLGGRWPQAESVISQSDHAELYAIKVVRKNWNEEVARKCPCWLYHFAKDVVGGKLPKEMHNLMLSFSFTHQNDPWLKKYFGTKKYQKVRKPSAP